MGLLEGRVAAIAGGARGIGLAIAKRFVEGGAKVALFGSRQETADKGVAKAKAAHPGAQVLGMAPNLTAEVAVEAAFREVASVFGKLDIVCNNAGISQSTPLVEYAPADFDKIIDLNIKSVLNGYQAAARVMGEAGAPGCIINTSSMVGTYGQSSGVGYPAS